MPNLQIIDCGFGFTGSTHDATAWEHTQIYKKCDKLLRMDEFVWADLAYPVRKFLQWVFQTMLNSHVQIDNWVVTPYKRPEHNHLDNEAFNKRVSTPWTCLEYAIGFLKGCFQSLQDLCVLIQDEKTHKSAVHWVVACITIHGFATRCELEKQADDCDLADDPFITAGLSPARDDGEPTPPTSQTQGSARFGRGKEKREQLKAAWMVENELWECGESE